MSDLRYLCFPYCLRRGADGRWILLNRRYKPLGFDTMAQVDYDAYPIALALRIGPTLAARLSYDGLGIREEKVDRETGERYAMLFLYNDSCVPTASAGHMQAYLARLALLAKVKVRDAGLYEPRVPVLTRGAA